MGLRYDEYQKGMSRVECTNLFKLLDAVPDSVEEDRPCQLALAPFKFVVFLVSVRVWVRVCLLL